MPYLAVKASASSGSSGAVPEITERMLDQVGRVEVGLEHHAQRRRHEARGRRAVAAHGVRPPVDGEPLEQAERTGRR